MDACGRRRGGIRSVYGTAVVAACALALSVPLAVPAAAAPGDGTLIVEVNRDFSGDGVFDPAFDPGQEGFDVTVTDGTSTLGPITTDADGQVAFDLSTLAGSRFRVDVTAGAAAPDHLEFAPAATTSVQNAFRSATTFVDGADQTIHVGVWNPDTYVTRNPKVAIAQQVDRATDPGHRSLMITDWDNRGPFDMTNEDNSAGLAQVATQAETGTVFGLAWDYRREGLFSAAYAKAHTLYGPGGPGAIYLTDTSAGGPDGNTALWATVPDAGDAVHQTETGRDDAFFYAAGSEGLGGLALSEDGATLYAVNLNNKTLYEFDTAAAAPAPVIGATVIADPGCVGGDWRPFAVTVRDGAVFVGGICDASDSLQRGDLSVHILRLDAGVFTEVYTHGLDFIRGAQNYPDPVPNLTDPGVSLHWNPWRDSWDADLIALSTARMPLYPMPLLTSFAFENDGSLILDFRDRKTDALVANGFGPDGTTPTGGHVAGGDLNKVCLTDGVFEWEGTGSCPDNATASNSAQPDDRVEFFPGEFMTGQPRYDANVVHAENSLGAVLLSPREPDVLATTMNPTQLYNSNGFGFYDRGNGSGPGNDWENRALLIAGNGTPGNFGKGSGLGGVSLLAAPAPIQIGNYVWFDADHDGEQDAEEIAVPGATVRLLDANGDVLATTTTDANGEYYFGGEGGLPLTPGEDYIVEFDLTTIDPGQLPGAPEFDALSFTLVQDANAGPVHDSNPTSTANPLIGRAPVTAPDHAGGVDHTIDAGIFSAVASIDIVKFDGRSDVPNDPVDGPDAVDGEYGGPTPGDWTAVIDADTDGDAVEYPVSAGTTGPQPVHMIVTNTGTTRLADLAVDDLTLEGPDLAGLSCDFSPLGGPDTGTTWTGPFQPNDAFTCTATLTMGATALHGDVASVTGQPVDDGGEPVGNEIGDEDPYWAVTPDEPGTTGVDITKREAGTGDEADTPEEAVAVAAGDAVGIEIPVTNTGALPLAQVVVSDRTDDGPAMVGFSCTFPDGTEVAAVDGEVRWAATFGDPAAAQWEPGIAFLCHGTVTLDAAETHADTAMVTAVAPDGTALSDDDPFHVETPKAEALSLTGGTIGGGVLALAAVLVGLGTFLILMRRRRPTDGETSIRRD